MFWVSMVRNGCGQFGHGTLKLTVSKPRMNGWNELIFCMLVQIQVSWKLFQWFFGDHVQKMGVDLVHETLKFALNLWIELIFFLLAMMQ